MPRTFCPDELISVINGVYTFAGHFCDDGSPGTVDDTRDHDLGECPDCTDPIMVD